MATNLPPQQLNDSGAATRLFFDRYGVKPEEFKAVEVDATIAFFEGSGFSRDASVVSAITLLKQSKRESVDIFETLDRLKKLPGLKLTQVVAEILNTNRVPTSALGFRTATTSDLKAREIDA
jgi:hypothetical protein